MHILHQKQALCFKNENLYKINLKRFSKQIYDVSSSHLPDSQSHNVK